MTQPAEAPAAADPATPATPETVDDRKAALLDKLNGSEPEAAAEAPAPAAEPPTDPKADRQKRIDTLQAREREAERRRSEKRKPEIDPRIVERAARADKLEAALGIPIDEILSATGSEEQFFRMAKRMNVKPQRLGEYIREQLDDPTKAAADEARHALSPFEKKLEEIRQQTADRIAGLEGELVRRDNVDADARAANALIAETRQQARQAPLSTAFLDRKGDAAFIELATAIANTLPPRSGLQAVLDQMEANLEALADVFVSQSTAKQNPPPRAAAKATTVTNSLASRRAGIADEDAEFAALPLDDRLAILKRKHG